ncbi:hypothetical protein ANCCEY_14449 [Ancylostoma ceylanicum]|uniref:Ras family protein n=1 Tax=Ancylostoma ceylanicum TaxID=53326 RepID=A0A0D6L9T6_9BILA|nr:hypothetical protein ANCCEY_14449 [Ancylostoma ceylanicum]
MSEEKSKQSLEELAPIVKTLMEVKGNSLSETPIMLVGNKSDDNTRGRKAVMSCMFALKRKQIGIVSCDEHSSHSAVENLAVSTLRQDKKAQKTSCFQSPS